METAIAMVQRPRKPVLKTAPWYRTVVTAPVTQMNLVLTVRKIAGNAIAETELATQMNTATNAWWTVDIAAFPAEPSAPGTVNAVRTGAEGNVAPEHAGKTTN